MFIKFLISIDLEIQIFQKSIRRATVNTFGYIAKAIGPHDVLATLLNNLKVQERQLRVCTTIAIAIVAETCSPFTGKVKIQISRYHYRQIFFCEKLKLFWKM